MGPGISQDEWWAQETENLSACVANGSGDRHLELHADNIRLTVYKYETGLAAEPQVTPI